MAEEISAKERKILILLPGLEKSCQERAKNNENWLGSPAMFIFKPFWSLKNLNDPYVEELAFSESNTIIDIYAKIDNLTFTFEKVFTTIESLDQKIDALEVKMENMVWQPKPTAPPINYAYSRMLVMSSEDPDSPSDMINIKTLSKISFQVSYPKLQWHCLENFYGNVYSIGGRHTEYEIYELDKSCRFQRMDITLPKVARVRETV